MRRCEIARCRWSVDGNKKLSYFSSRMSRHSRVAAASCSVPCASYLRCASSLRSISQGCAVFLVFADRLQMFFKNVRTISSKKRLASSEEKMLKLIPKFISQFCWCFAPNEIFSNTTFPFDVLQFPKYWKWLVSSRLCNPPLSRIAVLYNHTPVNTKSWNNCDDWVFWRSGASTWCAI